MPGCGLDSGIVRAFRRGAPATLLACCAGVATAAAPPDPGRLVWRELHYHARKLIFTADMRVRAELLPAAAAAAELLPATGHEAIAPCGERVARITLDTFWLGHNTRNTAWLEPATGAALQATSQELGERARFKAQRFAMQGVAVSRYAPGEGEEGWPASRWSRRKEEFLLLPAAGREGLAVSDSLALFWILATRDLATPGDTVTLALLSRGRLILVDVAVRAKRRVTPDFDELGAHGKRHVDDAIAALALSVDARAIAGGAAGDDLEFLGMKGSIRILLDPIRRVPLEVSGRVPVAGTVTVRLQDVVLSD